MPTWLDVTEFKEYARVDHTHEDALIGRLLDAAEGEIGDVDNGLLARPVTVTAFTEYFDSFEAVSLAHPDGATITSINYTDTDGATQTVSAIYTLRNGVLVLNDDEFWPTKDGEVTVEYTAGWATVPEAIKSAGYFYAASLYDARTSNGMDADKLRGMVGLMIRGYRRIGL